MGILIKAVLLDGKRKDIFIEGNKIQEIGSINRESEFKIKGNFAALPSFVNAHTHAAMTLFRGYCDDMALQEWLEQKIWPAEAKLTEEDVYNGAKLACIEMIKSGTTFFNDMYWHFHGTARAVEETGIRSAISPVLIDLFNEEKRKNCIKEAEKLFEESKKYGERIKYVLGPHAVYSVSEELLKWCREFADKNNLLLHIHASETKKEVDDCIAKNGLRPVEYLDKIGFLGKNVILAHSVWLNSKEIKLIKKNNASVVYNPTSNMKLSSGVFNYAAMKKQRINIALGTDGCASNNNLDILEEMKFGALLQKISMKNPISAKEIFDSATINGAKAFNLKSGEIKEGFLADLILIDLKHHHLNPHHDLISNVVYSANESCVNTTICNGKILMQDRKVENEEEIIENANATALNLVN